MKWNAWGFFPYFWSTKLSTVRIKHLLFNECLWTSMLTAHVHRHNPMMASLFFQRCSEFCRLGSNTNNFVINKMKKIAQRNVENRNLLDKIWAEIDCCVSSNFESTLFFRMFFVFYFLSFFPKWKFKKNKFVKFSNFIPFVCQKKFNHLEYVGQ